MTLDELMAFYTAQSNKEFDLVVARDGELDTIDFAHQSFCLSCANFVLKTILNNNVNHPDFITRLWANWCLYTFDQLQRKHREWN